MQCPASPGAAPGPAPADGHLHWLAASWGFGAWVDDHTGETRVNAPFAKDFKPFFSTRLKPLGFMAMNSIDAPLGNVTMVARIGGKLSIITLLVTY